MAISSYGIQLQYSTTENGTYNKLVDVKEVPDLMQPPEALETTTTSDSSQTYILGIQSSDVMEFTCNYTGADFNKIKGMKGTEYWIRVCLGNNPSNPGTDGKVTFQGFVDASISGAGVNEVVDMTVSVAPSGEMKFTYSGTTS